LGATGNGAPVFFGVKMKSPTGEATRSRGPGAAKTRVRSKPRKELVAQLLARIEKNLDLQKTKVNLSDFIRLVQLQRELDKEEPPAEVIVTWQELPENESVV